MTASQIITHLSQTTLAGLKIADLTVAENTTVLLQSLNMAKNKIAEDTLLWLGGETINIVSGTSEYTLSTIPIQIIDIFDNNNYLRPRNSQSQLGYYQTSPNTILFNTITNGEVMKINYYYTPADYIITDEVVIPQSLISALEFYATHKAYESYKTEKSMMASTEYYKKYRSAINDYKAVTDSGHLDSVLNMNNKIFLRGFK